MKNTFLVVGFVVVAIILSIVFIVLDRAVTTADKVTDPDRMIYNYDWFFAARASIKSYEAQVSVARNAVDEFKSDHAGNLESYANTTELARLREVERGLNNQLISLVNEYNVNAKSITKGLFKDWRLPSVLTLIDNKIVEAN